MTELEFDFLRSFLKAESGLAISRDKLYLVESRLRPVCETFGIENLSLLCWGLKNEKQTALKNAVIEAMTTNETFFFRDKSPFDLFEKILLPRLLRERAGSRRLRIWCAAASTGQEPYSLAIILKEAAAKLIGWRIEIMATDISHEILAKAKSGLYNQFEVQRGLPPHYLAQYFTKSGDLWQISGELRKMVDFRYANLLGDFGLSGQFDIVFCRNVLIYFDLPTKKDVLRRIEHVMATDGALILGAAETVLGVSDVFSSDPAHRGLFCKSTALRRPADRVFA